MRSHRLTFVWLGIGVLSACDGTSAQPDAPGAPPDAPGDAPTVPCDPPGALCDGVCVNLADSPTSCGQCGHDCGGGACTRGRCQPVVVADQLDQPAALAVSSTAIFWTERTQVRSCPLPLGCVFEPRLIGDVYSMLNSIAVTEDKVYFTGCRGCDDHHDLRQCPVSGCPVFAQIVTFTLYLYQEVIAGPTHAYWYDAPDAPGGRLFGCEHADCLGTREIWSRTVLGGSPGAVAIDGDTVYVKLADGGDLRTCPEAMGCDAPEILPNTSSIRPPFRVHRGMAYWFESGNSSLILYTCPVADCRSATLFAPEAFSIPELEVDDTGVYWINPSLGMLRYCPLTGCPPGGAVTLARGRAEPKALTLGAGFVYWIEGDAIFKLAKP